MRLLIALSLITLFSVVHSQTVLKRDVTYISKAKYDSLMVFTSELIVAVPTDSLAEEWYYVPTVDREMQVAYLKTYHIESDVSIYSRIVIYYKEE